MPVQPLIAPLFGAMTELEVLAVFAAGEGTSPRTGHEVVQSTFTGDSWERYLHDGFLKDSGYEEATELTIANADVTVPPAQS